MQQDRYEGLHTEWFHLDDVLKKTQAQGQRLVISSHWGRCRGLTAIRHEGNLGGDRNVLHFYCAGGYYVNYTIICWTWIIVMWLTLDFWSSTNVNLLYQGSMVTSNHEMV